MNAIINPKSRGEAEEWCRKRQLTPVHREELKGGTLLVAERWDQADLGVRDAGGLCIPHWKVFMFLERGKLDWYGWFAADWNSRREDRIAKCIADAEQFIADNVKVGRYAA